MWCLEGTELATAFKETDTWSGYGVRAYVEDALCRTPAGLIILLCQSDELFGHALRLLCFGMCGLDVLVMDELGNEASKKSLPRARVAAQVSIFHCATSHDFCECRLRMARNGKCADE
jgi:hypothetical protein